jgi:response regulator of citrate/malate metabolism
MINRITIKRIKWLTKLFAANQEWELLFILQVQKYLALLDDVIVKDNGINLVPELYYVPKDKVCLISESYHNASRRYRLDTTKLQTTKNVIFH